MLHSLSEWNPLTVLYYKWGYSYEEIAKYYKAKTKEYMTKREADYKFILDVVGAVFGSKKSESEIHKDDGAGIDTRTDEQDAAMREMLGDDYTNVVGSV